MGNFLDNVTNLGTFNLDDPATGGKVAAAQSAAFEGRMTKKYKRGEIVFIDYREGENDSHYVGHAIYWGKPSAKRELDEPTVMVKLGCGLVQFPTRSLFPKERIDEDDGIKAMLLHMAQKAIQDITDGIRWWEAGEKFGRDTIEFAGCDIQFAFMHTNDWINKNRL